MKKIFNVSIIVLIANLILISSCGVNPFSQKHKKKQGLIIRTYVHGDPEVILKDSVPNVTSFINTDNFKDFNDFEFANGVMFEEYTKHEGEDTPLTHSDLEEENKAETEDVDTLMPKNNPFRFQKSQDGSFIYEAQNFIEMSLTLDFKVSGKNLFEISRIGWNGRYVDVTPRHYSLSKDENAFSILVSLRDPQTESPAILALYFTRARQVGGSFPRADREYNFIAGPGYRAV